MWAWWKLLQSKPGQHIQFFCYLHKQRFGISLSVPCEICARKELGPSSTVLLSSISHCRNPSRLKSAAKLLGGGPQEYKGLIVSFKLCSQLKITGPEPQEPDHGHILPISLPVLELPRCQMQTWGRPEGGSRLCLRTVLSYVCWRWHLFNTAGKLSTPVLGFFQALQLAQVLHLASWYILDTFPQALLPQALFQVQWFFKHCKTPVPWPLLGRCFSPFSVTSWKKQWMQISLLPITQHNKCAGCLRKEDFHHLKSLFVEEQPRPLPTTNKHAHTRACRSL